MPTALPSGEKAAFIAIVNVAPYPGGANEAARLQTILNTYEDIPTAITRQLPLFESNNSYLINAITVFNDNMMQTAGIWVNKDPTIGPLTNPVLIINSTINLVNIVALSPPIYNSLCILGPSLVKDIVLAAGVELNELYIGPGATVDVADSSNAVVSPPNSPPTIIGKIYLPFEKSTPSNLNAIKYLSVVNQVIVDPGSYYGGVQASDPDLACAETVSGISAQEITKNSVFVSWTPPTTYLFINTSYKKSNSKVWVEATEDIGDFSGDSGFVFRDLESDTFYDVRIAVQCLNGGWSFQTISFQTVCCGAGTMMSLYKQCQITMLISASIPSPPPAQTLCNGVSIPLYYPPGTTITIPYLATVNCAVVSDMVIDNSTFQLMPFNKGLGQWDASGTSIHGFNDLSVVTVGMSLPA